MQAVKFIWPPLTSKQPGFIRPLTTIVILLRWLEEEQQVVLRLVLRKVVLDP